AGQIALKAEASTVTALGSRTTTAEQKISALEGEIVTKVTTTEVESIANAAAVEDKAYADAQDNLKQVETKAYADGIVTAEEARAIADAQTKLQEAKDYANTRANQAENNAIQDAALKYKLISQYNTERQQLVNEINDRVTLSTFN